MMMYPTAEEEKLLDILHNNNCSDEEKDKARKRLIEIGKEQEKNFLFFGVEE